MQPVYSVIGVAARVMAAYAFLFILLPMFALQPWLRRLGSMLNRMLLAYVVGHFFIVQLVFVLGFLGLCQPWLFVFLVLGAALGTRLLLERGALAGKMQRFQANAMHVLNGEFGKKHLLYQHLRQRRAQLSTWCRTVLLPHLPEVLALLACTVFVLAYYLQYPLVRATFAAPDEEVHLYYIQAMLDGEIYTRGVYPFGFHNIGAALTMFFGIQPVDFIRVECLIGIVMIMGMLYLWMRRVFRFRAGLVVALAVYNLFLFYSLSAMRRYQYALPQEYAMIFLCPMLIYLTSYLRHKKRRDLILFGISLSLVLSCHFYTALAAAFVCLAFGLIYLVRMVKRRMLVPVVVCAVVFVGASLVPIGIGKAMGKPWEQAMGWAVGVMNDVDIYATEEAPAEEEVVYTDLASRVAGVAKTVQEGFFENKTALYLYLCTLPFAAGMTWYSFKKRRSSDAGMILLSLFLLQVFWLVLACSKPLGLPTIMDTPRTSIFFAYFSVLFLAAPLELAYVGLARKAPRGKRLLAWLTCLVLVVLLVGQQFMPRYKRVPYFNPVQTRGAMLSTLRIIDSYEPNTWTIISPTQETGIVANKGYHYELIDLLLGQEFWRPDMEIYIPTPYMFLYVEKRPINPFGGDNSSAIAYEVYINRKEISAQEAEAFFEPVNDSGDYYKYNRYLVMSRAYYWMEQYKKHYPDSVNIYYEDSEIIVYRMVQNEYALHNLALDYGYNSRFSY